MLEAIAYALNLAAAALHVVPAPGVVAVQEIPYVVRQAVQPLQHHAFVADELHAINLLRAQNGLPPLDQHGQPLGEQK
jgi:hypothetical protein